MDAPSIRLRLWVWVWKHNLQTREYSGSTPKKYSPCIPYIFPFREIYAKVSVQYNLIKFKLNTYKNCVLFVCQFRLYIVFMLHMMNIKNWFLGSFLSVLPWWNRFIEELSWAGSNRWPLECHSRTSINIA